MSTVRIQLRRGLANDWASIDPTLAAGEVGFESDTNKFKIGNNTDSWTELPYANVTAAGLENSLSNYIEVADRGQANGVASLDSSGYVPTTQLPPLAKVTVSSVADQTARLALTAEAGDIAIQTDTGVTYALSASPASTNSNWKVISDPNITTDLSIGGDTLTLNSNNTQGPNGSIVVKRDTEPDAILFWNEAGGNWSVSDDGGATNNYISTKAYAEGLLSTHNSDTTFVHGIEDTSALSTKSYAEGLVSTHNSDTTNVHGITDTSALATSTYVDGKASDAETNAIAEAATAAATAIATAVSNHSDDTTNVHGITDTSALATKSYADNKASDAESNAISAAAIAASSAIGTAISNHSEDTTSVHGISDTSLLTTTTNTQTLTNKTLTSPKINEDVVLTATATELNYVDGVTSAIQTQIDAKASSTDLSSHASDTTSIHGISDTSQLAYLNAANQTFTGNMELDGNLVVDGDFTVNGTNFSASATSITIEDNIVQLAHQNSANTVDLGLVVAYNDGTAKHSGIVRDVSDSKWKIFKDVTDEPATTVNFGQGSLDDLAVNNLTAAGIVFTDGTQSKQGVPSQTSIIQKTGAYTLSSLTERDSLIEVSSATGVTITVPANSSVAYPVGTSIDILQTSTGQVTIAGSGGVTVNATPGLKLRTQWSSATLFKRATDTWVLMGDLTA